MNIENPAIALNQAHFELFDALKNFNNIVALAEAYHKFGSASEETLNFLVGARVSSETFVAMIKDTCTAIIDKIKKLITKAVTFIKSMLSKIAKKLNLTPELPLGKVIPKRDVQLGDIKVYTNCINDLTKTITTLKSYAPINHVYKYKGNSNWFSNKINGPMTKDKLTELHISTYSKIVNYQTDLKKNSIHSYTNTTQIWRDYRDYSDIKEKINKLDKSLSDLSTHATKLAKDVTNAICVTGNEDSTIFKPIKEMLNGYSEIVKKVIEVSTFSVKCISDDIAVLNAHISEIKTIIQ